MHVELRTQRKSAPVLVLKTSTVPPAVPTRMRFWFTGWKRQHSAAVGACTDRCMVQNPSPWVVMLTTPSSEALMSWSFCWDQARSVTRFLCSLDSCRGMAGSSRDHKGRPGARPAQLPARLRQELDVMSAAGANHHGFATAATPPRCVQTSTATELPSRSFHHLR